MSFGSAACRAIAAAIVASWFLVRVLIPSAAMAQVQAPTIPYPPPDKVAQAAEVISTSKRPLVMVGNGVIRGGACTALRNFIDFRGEAIVATRIDAVLALLRDASRFKEWFPNTSESQLLSR